MDRRVPRDLERGSINKDSPPPSPPQQLGAQLVDGRRLLHRIDLRILPILSLCYLFAFLDRVNIGHVIYSPDKTRLFSSFLSFFLSHNLTALCSETRQCLVSVGSWVSKGPSTILLCASSSFRTYYSKSVFVPTPAHCPASDPAVSHEAYDEMTGF